MFVHHDNVSPNLRIYIFSLRIKADNRQKDRIHSIYKLDFAANILAVHERRRLVELVLLYSNEYDNNHLLYVCSSFDDSKD